MAKTMGQPLLVFSDDWGRHPSSCQHLVRHLLDRHEVYWINTIGTRRPSLDWATVRRGLEKLKHWSRREEPQALPPNLQVLNPKMWPAFSSNFGRWLNRQVLHRQLSSVIQSMPAVPIAITTLPIVADLVGRLPVARWVYYCVDDFSQWPGLDQAVLERMERDLVQRADTLIAVSETLQGKLTRMGRKAHLLTHGIEPGFWKSNGRALPLPQLSDLERPLIVFWGVIDRRMDVHFLQRLASDLSKGTLVFVGPESDPDPMLRSLSRLVRLGPVPFETLPSVAGEAAVLVMPYADLPVTQAMQPLKLKEYLATGKPVVASSLSATREWADSLDLADSPAAFSQAVRLRVETGLPLDQETARVRLADESWSDKARAFERWILHTELERNFHQPEAPARAYV